jgi:hypothetical protein
VIISELIETLEKEDQSKVCPKGFANPHSYRGYYDSLAFEPADNVTVGEMLDSATRAMGSTYQGWKGGNFYMGPYVDVYLANEGCCGDELSATLLGYMLRDAE